VSLTRSGRALITRIFDRHRSVLDAAADGLKRAERKELIVLLKKLGLSAQARLADDSGEDGATS
jgi:DNA-binding MarR family transcriptional regulator